MLPLPSVDAARALLGRLDVDEVDAAEIVDGWPSPVHDPALVADLADAYDAFVGGRPVSWQPDPARPWFHVYLFLAAVDHVRGLHAGRAIRDDVSWATLRALGRSLRLRRRLTGRGGLSHGAEFLSHHFAGRLYRLGRLEFELATVAHDGTPFAPDRSALNVHIPDGGPLDPDAADTALEAAAAFFPRHFPEADRSVAVCMSWLLDPQLTEYLPPTSNIVRFQRRFELTQEAAPGDDAVFRFVFERETVDPRAVRQRTTLDRAIVAHLRAGRHWHERFGWLALQAQQT